MIEKKTILIVDDEIRITRSFAQNFRHDYRVLTANSGEDALKIIREKAPDLVVLDWRLKSAVDGKDVLNFSKVTAPRTPVLVITASVHSEEEIKARGADYFLTKSCDPKEKIMEVLPP